MTSLADQPPRPRAGQRHAPIAPAATLAIALHLLVLLALDARWQRDGELPPRPAVITVTLAPRAAAVAAPPAEPEASQAPTAPQPTTAAAAAPLSAAQPPADQARAVPRTAAAAAAGAVASTAPAAQPASPAGSPARAPLPARTVPADEAAPAPERIVLFAPDGRLRVPTAVLEGEPPPVASWIAAPHEPAPWETRTDPLVYEPTAFEAIWKPDRESLLDEFVRLNTRTRTFRTPWGSKVTCSWVLVVGGCAW